MTKKTVNTVTGWLVLIALMTHVFGYFFWKWVNIINIYYATVYFNMLIDGLAMMIITTGPFWRMISTVIFWFGGQFLYMELFRDPMNWTDTDIAVFLIAGLNSIMINHFLNSFKPKLNG